MEGLIPFTQFVLTQTHGVTLTKVVSEVKMGINPGGSNSVVEFLPSKQAPLASKLDGSSSDTELSPQGRHPGF